MCQVEKFKEAKVLQHFQLVLEKCDVELSVAVWSDLDELGNEEGCVTVLVFTHAVLISTK